MSRKHEYEFLPAALEIQESPPSPIGRAIIYLLILLFSLAVIWSYFGKVDIVAVAHGKIIPGGRDKVIQPLEIGVVHKIHVSEGQQVKRGDVLIELDATNSSADKERTEMELLNTRLEVARLAILLQKTNVNTSLSPQTTSQESLPQATDPFAAYQDTAPNQVALQQSQLESQLNEFSSNIQAIEDQINEQRAKYAVTMKVIKKLRATLPIVTERANALKKLLDSNMGSRQAYLELEQQRIEQQQDIETSKAQLVEIKAAVASAKQRKKAYAAEYRHQQLAQLTEANRKIAALEQELEKVDQRHNLEKLIAPVSGVVQQLAIHTEGAVVTPAQELMRIVPSERHLEVEAWVANKDIGFVNTGQTAEVKVDAFPFTKYGTLDAKLTKMSPDAVPDENLGLVYRAQVLMEKTVIQVEDKLIDLVPGMSVTVEVKTGKRRLLEYFLSPLMEYQDESIRER